MTTGGSSFWNSGAVPLIEPEALSGIIAAASDIALVVSADAFILSVVVNSHSESFGNLKHWEGRPVSEFLTRESVPKFQAAHEAYLAGETPQKQLELNHQDNAIWQYPVRYTFHRFGHENAALLLGRDLKPIAETQQQLVQAQIALEQGYEARREFDARYRVLLGHVGTPVVFMSVQTGRVEDANDAAARLLGLNLEALRGSSFAQHFAERSSVELTESLMSATLADEQGHLELVVARTRTTLTVRPIVFRAGGQRVLMCRLNSEEGVAPLPDALASNTLELFRRGMDPMLFMTDQGVISAVNESFMDLLEAAHLSDVVGRSLSDFLARGQIDLAVLTDQPQRARHMRVYSTKLMNDLGNRLPVEISATPLTDGDAPIIGCVVRDVSRSEAARPSTADTGASGQGPNEPTRNVMDLVGAASLKEIVAETTDVVEKMCIETAVQLTNNNRVAAADMLGLSRQSLYVKLRKYGLLNKHG